MSRSSKETLPVIALAGNPNVGKSSIFNKLTGLRRHTGNWAGKTVDNASGICRHNGKSYILTDIPGTYSLLPHSFEEEVARDFIIKENPDVVVVVCDASCLERNLNLVLQTTEITHKVVVCVNLIDEAARHGLKINLERLSERLGVPVVGTVAKKEKGLDELMDACAFVMNNKSEPVKISYTKPIEAALCALSDRLDEAFGQVGINHRWLALRLLENDTSLSKLLGKDLYEKISSDSQIISAIAQCQSSCDTLCDTIASCTVLAAEYACDGVLESSGKAKNTAEAIDRIVTGKAFGIPIMLALLALIFWLTISFANIPSQMLADFFSFIEEKLLIAAKAINIPELIYSPLIFGVYHILTRVIAVMLPPMAIFFPLFTILEDLGFLPRIAFNLDRCFHKCSACGKQALTMCMGFGCNAVGVTGCRIIDSPRERLIAILTNSFVPCNGRFPTIISIITMFLVVSGEGSVVSAFILLLAVLLGIFVTFLVSWLLSKTLLRGTPSSFTLELPPYRKPDISGIIVRSVFDRIAFVLYRAIIVAAPAGLIIWLFSNITVAGVTLLSHASAFLDPFARLIGMDGTILLAFILGFPANEIVIPLITMAYMSSGTITDAMSLAEIRELFIANGWTVITAVNVIIFSVLHWPCSTTLLTVKKETGSIKWTVAAFLIPTLVGILFCFLFTHIAKIFV